MLSTYEKPIEDTSENSFMVHAVAVTFVNPIELGAVGRIPTEVVSQLADAYLHHVTFNILVFGAYFLNIGILLDEQDNYLL